MFTAASRLRQRRDDRPKAAADEASIERRLVWMIGSPRTGSTWLLNLLALHPQVRCIDEPLIGAHLGMSLSGLVATEAAAKDGDHVRLIDRYGDRPDYFFSDRYESVWRPALRTLLLTRLGAQLRDAAGNPDNDYLILKEPHGSEGADLLSRTLPEARYLVLVRDGRDVLDSVLDGLRPGAWAADVATVGAAPEERARFVQSYAKLWVLRTRAALHALEKAGSLGVLVRYEDLLQNTISGLQGIYDWLGLVVPPDVAGQVEQLSFAALPAEDKGSGHFARAATPGLWREHLSEAEQQRALQIMGPMLHELGYSEPG
ncbi:MAG: sulfotransferase family protein [Actinomycetes bacterium]